MTAYLIVYGKDPIDRFAAYMLPTREAARMASLPAAGLVPRVPAGGPAGGQAYIVETEEDVLRSPLVGQLVNVYNQLDPVDNHVNRFESRVVGVRRLLTRLAIQARTPSGAASHPIEEKTMSDVDTNGQGRGRGRPRVEGQMTMAEQMAAYNVLADQAIAKGLKFRRLGGKNGTSTFATYAMGEKAITKINEAIAAN